MGRSSGLCLHSVCSDQGGSHQAYTLSKYSSDSCGSLVATEGMVSGYLELGDSSFSGAPCATRPAAAVALPSSSSSTPHASASDVETVWECKRELGVSRAMDRQLSQCHRAASQLISASLEVLL